jgi:hypothetical protein
MKSTFFSPYRVRSHLKLVDAIQRESVLLQRVSLEFEQQKESLERKLTEGANGMKFIYDLKSELKDEFMESITYNIALLEKHLSLVRLSFSEYVSTLNMRINLQLQRRALILSIMFGIATLVGAAAIWETPKRLLGDLFKVLFERIK